MTRRGETQPSAAEPDTQLKVLRAQIDKLDLQILELLNKRASIATDR
jgi:chorismate mutase